MEDVVNAIRKVNNVELNEEIEYHWERTETKS